MPFEATNSPGWPGATPETIGMGEFAVGAAGGEGVGGGDKVDKVRADKEEEEK